jgi:hypothetical protein
MTTKIEGPNAEVDASAAELARANERHTKVNAADAAKLDKIAGAALGADSNPYSEMGFADLLDSINALAAKIKGGAL